MRRIDDRLGNLETQLLGQGVLDANSEEDLDEEKGEESKTEPRKRSPAIPELLYVDWQKFKHKIAEQKEYAVDILTGPAKYYYEREEEGKMRKIRMVQLRNASTEVLEGSANLQPEAGNSEELPERIRINSLPILTILGNIDSEDKWGPQPAVILRPFKPLVYYGSQIRNTLQSLEAEWGEAEKEASSKILEEIPAADTNPIKGEENGSKVEAESESSVNKTLSNPSPGNHIGQDSVDEERSNKIEEDAKQDISADGEIPKDGESEVTKDEPEDLANSIEALRDLRCLISFMDRHLDPVVARYRSNECEKVSFNDLWHLFKPGELIYGPLGLSRAATEVSIDINGLSKVSSSQAVDRFQEVWKVVSTAGGRAKLRAEQSSDDEDQMLLQKYDETGSELPSSRRLHPFIIVSYYVDFDGSTFLPASSQVNIDPFKGFKDITSLSIYPLRFAKNQIELRSKWLARGKRFREYVTPRHLYYEGRSITSRPAGYQTELDNFPKYSGNIDSEVVVDFKEAVSTHPTWTNHTLFVAMKSIFMREFSEDYPIYYWSEGRQSKLIRKEDEYCYIDRRIDEKMMESVREQDELIRDFPDKALEEDWKLGDEHLILLPNRVFAFVMKYRKFGRYIGNRMPEPVVQSLNINQLLFPLMVFDQSIPKGMHSMTSSYRLGTKKSSLRW